MTDVDDWRVGHLFSKKFLFPTLVFDCPPNPLGLSCLDGGVGCTVSDLDFDFEVVVMDVFVDTVSDVSLDVAVLDLETELGLFITFIGCRILCFEVEERCTEDHAF